MTLKFCGILQFLKYKEKLKNFQKNGYFFKKKGKILVISKSDWIIGPNHQSQNIEFETSSSWKMFNIWNFPNFPFMPIWEIDMARNSTWSNIDTSHSQRV